MNFKVKHTDDKLFPIYSSINEHVQEMLSDFIYMKSLCHSFERFKKTHDYKNSISIYKLPPYLASTIRNYSSSMEKQELEEQKKTDKFMLFRINYLIVIC